MSAPAAPAGMWRSGLHTLATSVMSVGIGLLTSVLIARTLGPTKKGGYDLTIAAGALISLALGMSLQIGTTYAVARRLANPTRLVPMLLGWAALQAGVAAAFVLVASGTSLGDAVLPATLGVSVCLPLAAIVLLTSATGYLRAVLVGQQRIIAANNGDILGRIAGPVLMVIAVIAWTISSAKADALVFVLCGVAGLALTLGYFAVLLRRQPREDVASSGIRTVIAFSAPSYLGNLVQFLNYRMDLFLVNAFVGIAAVGIYGLAVSVAQLLWLVSTSAATVLLPHVAAEGDGAASAARTVQVSRITFTVSMTGALFLAVFGRFLIPFVYGEQFRASLEPFLLLMPGIAGFSAVNVLAAYIAGIGRPRINLAIAVVAFLVTLVFDLALIPSLGPRGAALASTLSYLTSTLVTAAVFSRLTGLPFLHAFIPTSGDMALVRRLFAGMLRYATLFR